MATVLVESSAVYSAFSLLFLVPFAMGSSIANVFVQPLCQFQVRIFAFSHQSQGLTSYRLSAHY
jgi:hypothetical protein